MDSGDKVLSKSISVIKEFENRLLKNSKSTQREASTSEIRYKEQSSRPGL